MSSVARTVISRPPPGASELPATAPQILLMVDADVDRPAMLALVLAHFPVARRQKDHACLLRGNLLEIWPNEDADPARSWSDEDTYLFYRWRVEVSPMDDSVGEDHQVQLARDLRSAFLSTGVRVDVLAAFEARL